MTLTRLQRLGISLVALFFGFSILGVSLVVTSQVLSSGSQSMSSRKFYFASEVKPDHVLYPVFMAFDRVRLETATQEEQVLLELVYAQRRFEHGQELLQAGDEELAATTFSKAQKYLISAAQRAQRIDLDPAAQSKMHLLITEQSDELKTMTPDIGDPHASVLNRLVEETKLVAAPLAQVQQ